MIRALRGFLRGAIDAVPPVLQDAAKLLDADEGFANFWESLDV